ncbi:MAG: cyclase family protein [Porticoccaceae bacterium]|nr:cyclase family protein [Porticoccaceae bacterium]
MQKATTCNPGKYLSAAGSAMVAGLLGAVLLSVSPAAISGNGLPGNYQQVVDLTHSYDENTIYWPTASGFKLHIDFHGYTDKGYYYEANSFSTAEHGGTHLDAPVHFAEGQRAVAEIPLTNLMAVAAVIDVSEQCRSNRDYQVTIADIQAWEKRHGQLADGAILLLKTGFAQYWPDRERYMGTAERGEEAVAKLHFPGLHPQAAQWLATERRIAAVGLDTPSIDYGQSTLFESHQYLFKANIPVFENVANLDALPPNGAYVIALPMKIKAGSGAPLRIIALLP